MEGRCLADQQVQLRALPADSNLARAEGSLQEATSRPRGTKSLLKVFSVP